MCFTGDGFLPPNSFLSNQSCPKASTKPHWEPDASWKFRGSLVTITISFTLQGQKKIPSGKYLFLALVEELFPPAHSQHFPWLSNAHSLSHRLRGSRCFITIFAFLVLKLYFNPVSQRTFMAEIISLKNHKREYSYFFLAAGLWLDVCSLQACLNIIRHITRHEAASFLFIWNPSDYQLGLL